MLFPQESWLAQGKWQPTEKIKKEEIFKALSQVLAVSLPFSLPRLFRQQLYIPLKEKTTNLEHEGLCSLEHKPAFK